MNWVGSQGVHGKIRKINVTFRHKTAQPKTELIG
jgi:hypothetical protein